MNNAGEPGDEFKMEYQMKLSLDAASDQTFIGQPDDEAIRMIREFEPMALQLDPRGYCVCTSEGKDSRVLGHLMRRAGVKHFYLHSITGIDPPELVYFQRRNFQEYNDSGFLTYDVKYEMSIWRLMMIKQFPPMRHMRYCCEHLKERRTSENGEALLSMGVRKYESTNRAKKRDELEIVPPGRVKKNIILPFDNNENRRTFENCYMQCEKRLNPLAYWPTSYIWDYSKEAGLQQCELYNEGFERLGCIGCPMASEKGRRLEFERWPKFEALYRRAFATLFEQRKASGNPKMNKFDTSEEWFEWWISDTTQEQIINEDQLMISENGGKSCITKS